ncbi:MAG: DNA topoisomerase 3 [Polyangiales bacterium]
MARDTWRVIVVVAEKPSVARDIARVLGARERTDGALRGNGYLVTWAIGHLVALAQPEQINARWKGWRFESLPMLPQEWPLTVLDGTRKQFEIVQRWLKAPETREVVCATDAGREGELIFRYIAEQAGLDKPVKRLWVSSLTDEAIRAGFRKLQDATAYEPLADAARGRSRADWLVGMNLSRAYTLLAGSRGSGVLSVGRVQTPTLALLVERDRAIRAFVPELYQEVVIECAHEQKPFEARFVRTHQDNEATRLDPKTEEAAKIHERARVGEARVHTVEREEKRSRPQLLYDLTELQRHASRLYGFSASRTLALAQKLYEEHKLISYPRTDSRHLSEDVARELPAITEAVAPPYRSLLEPESLRNTLGKRFVDDGQVRDHHAIIPTGKPSRLATGSDEWKLYDLIVRRLLAAYQSDYVWAVTTVRIELHGEEIDRYLATGTTMLQLGYRALDVITRRRDPDAATLPPLSEGQPLKVADARVEDKQTRPPPHYNEASLLTAMETAGRSLDDKELSDAMRERGLGTPATRAAVIETLLSRGFIVREDKTLRSTAAGEALIDAVHPQVRSPAMTGEWEYKLREIERGRGKLDAFMAGIEAFVAELVANMGGGTRPPLAPAPRENTRNAKERDAALAQARKAAAPPKPIKAVSAPVVAAPPNEPQPKREPLPVELRVPLEQTLAERFGHRLFRPHQRVICEHLVAGRDVLVVMPTGAGKSLCYQLPGLARGGTTLVVSPLIALIEDQTSKLNAAGMRAERIHSGLPREAARETCRAYLRGELDYLFIAPERLRVPGFTELLERRPPTLIAIDEAHCISQWGHDFRPDYRLLRERLPQRGVGPIVALTATATPSVQRDIVEQLGMPQAVQSIHGFRRDNLAIHVLDAPPGQRPTLAGELLAQPGRLPAIVYAPSRALAEQTAAGLRGVRAAAYHAGMEAAARDRVQRAFLGSELDVVVATIAFGMGVDKADVRTVVHLASSSSVEAYYQEIGRAGRDGKPSVAMMLCSGQDRRTQQFFFERDYPLVGELERVFVELGEAPTPKHKLAKKLKLEDNALDAILDKLWLHGGARVDPDDGVTRGNADFRRGYPKHRASKAAQLAHMERYLDTRECRMLALLSHFGDTDNAQAPCGHCDRCRPNERPLRTVQVVESRVERGSKRASKRALDEHVPEKLLAALRAFRREEAATRGIPPFRVLTDRALHAIAQERPSSEAALRALPGVGPSVAKKYGTRLLRIVRD